MSATLRIQEESVSADTMPGDDEYRWNAEEENGEDLLDINYQEKVEVRYELVL